MPKADSEKIKLVPKRTLGYALGAVCIIFIGLLVALAVTKLSQPQHILRANAKTYHVTIVISPADQEKGLGDRTSLPTNEGMLFAFPSSSVRCFWMKDMHFPLDMIWLNTHKQIVHIQQNVSPNTYPEIFCPSTPAEYVLELNAGQAQVAHLRNGQMLNF